MKQYNVRFYTGKVADEDGEVRVSDIFTTFAGAQVLQKMSVGNLAYEIRNFTPLNNNESFSGVFAVLRDDAPHIRQKDGSEKQMDLSEDEHVIEKNHFLYYRKNELLVWQVNGNGSHISKMQLYLSHLCGKAVSIDDIIAKDSLDRLYAGVVRGVKFRLARPRDANSVCSDDWSSMAMSILNGAEASTITINMTAGRKKRGLSAFVKEQIQTIMKSDEIRAVYVKLADVEQPIDLFADCIREKISVNMIGLYPNVEEVFHELSLAKDRRKVELDEYFKVDINVLD